MALQSFTKWNSLLMSLSPIHSGKTADPAAENETLRQVLTFVPAKIDSLLDILTQCLGMPGVSRTWDILPLQMQRTWLGIE